MHNEFKNKLASVRSSSEQVYKTSTDVKTICQEVNKELVFYANIIPEFFSYKNEAVRIKALYKKLKTLDYARNKVLSCVNVTCAGYLYDEYLSGMYSFIDNFFKEVRSNGQNIPLMEKQLQTAIQGDPLFIESLFGGKNNEVVEEELTDAISNVEYLVDFLEKINGMNQMVNDVCNIAIEFPSYEYSIDTIRLIANSTCLFSNRVIGAIMDIYEAIHNKLDNKDDKPVDSSFKVF